MAEQHDPAAQKAALRKIINTAHTAFLVTASDKGLHGRPMVTAEASENLDVFYFPTARDSGKVEELAKDDSVFIGYVTGNEWATISGRGKIVDDRAKDPRGLHVALEGLVRWSRRSQAGADCRHARTGRVLGFA